MNTKKIIAILMASFQKWGCPVCGYTLGDNQDAGPGYQDFICGQCNQKLSLLGNNLLCTPYMVGDPPEHIYIEGRHPREGIPSHDVQIKPKEFEGLITRFEKDMAHNPDLQDKKINSIESVVKLVQSFPQVINHLGEYLDKKYIDKGFGISVDHKMVLLFKLILVGVNLENLPDPVNGNLNDWKNWALNFKY